MTTIKLRLENRPGLLKERKAFSSIVRISFNRYQDGMAEKEVRAYVRDRFGGVNSWIVQCGVKAGHQLFKRHGNRRIVFGGKRNLERYLKGQITKDEYRLGRLMPLTVQGERLQKGNRLFDFDFANNEMTLKLSKSDHRKIAFKPPHRKLKNNLTRLQQLADGKALAVTVSLTEDYACISFDESLISDCRFERLRPDRVLGVDMNPNYIGLSVLEFSGNGEFKILDKKVFDLTGLTRKSGKSPSDRKSKYAVNKLRHETIHMAHDVASLADYWKCGKVAIEDLSIEPGDIGKGKGLNRLCNNAWCRNLFSGKMKTLGALCRFELVEVNPCYSSFIGNVVYGNETTPDMVAASVEIARRGYRKFEKGWFYPSIRDDRIDERWKQTLSRFDDWKSAFSEIKKSKMKYRFLL